MDKDKLEGLLVDYIDNKLDPNDRSMVEKILADEPDVRKLYGELREIIGVMEHSAAFDPGRKLKTNFDRTLRDEIDAEKTSKLMVFPPAFYRVAAAIALLVIGGGIGFMLSRQNDEKLAGGGLRENQDPHPEVTRQMIAMVSNDQSASERIRGVNVAMALENADDEIVNALVKLMNEDPNSNVRLAALDALSRFIDEAPVKKHIINSLPMQKDPIVQIALIQLLVKIKEKSVVHDLQNIVDDEGTMQAVKDEAYTGILKLS